MSESITDVMKVTQIELVYRNPVKAKDRPVVTKSETAYALFRSAWDESKIELQEQFKVMLLNARSACLGIVDIGTGGMTACTVDQRLVFVAALKSNATSIILAHNHPSGNMKESQADINLTRRMVHGGGLIDIRVLDHLIVTVDGYRSFADEGLMPS